MTSGSEHTVLFLAHNSRVTIFVIASVTVTTPQFSNIKFSSSLVFIMLHHPATPTICLISIERLINRKMILRKLSCHNRRRIHRKTPQSKDMTDRRMTLRTLSFEHIFRTSFKHLSCYLSNISDLESKIS
ncbi:hypothetical protein Hdeb2414_s0111g00798381 [Helianthus debilis subsp. tardiflorus]